MRNRNYLFLLLISLFSTSSEKINAQTESKADYSIQLDVVTEGFDGESCWFHPRAGIIPGKNGTEIVFTMQKWMVKRSDVFFPLWGTSSSDNGKTWSKIIEHSHSLGRTPGKNGTEIGISDFSPKWHAKSGKLLGTGHTVTYKDNHLVPGSFRRTIYSVYDQKTGNWSKWESLDLPDTLKFYSEGAGSTQRIDLPNGDILLPSYFGAKQEKLNASVTVMRCRFDGEKLRYIEHGSELSIDNGRGFVEPSITQFKGRYYLTIRNDNLAYVAVSNDGLHYDQPIEWRFDDGESLGNYNTQQHWVTHSDGLYLVYTRKGANNENVIRHRAPLFIAKINTEKMAVIRSSEKILVPNKGAQLGNFGVVNINENETWVTTSEGMSQGTAYGANGRVYAARIVWSKPNKLWNKQ